MNGTQSTLSVALVAIVVSPVLAGPDSLSPGQADTPDAIVVIYDPLDGSVHVSGNDLSMTTFQLLSSNRWFDCSAHATHQEFLASNASRWACNDNVLLASHRWDSVELAFDKLSFGRVLPVGLSAQQLLGDLRLAAVITDGETVLGAHDEALGGGPYLHVVPEPSAVTLFIPGWISIMVSRRIITRKLSRVVEVK